MRNSLRRLFLVLAFFCISLGPAFARTNNLALTPPMGWNSWNKFHCGINEMIIEGVADAMATNGMKAAGYQYINIDDGWAASRDTNGVLVVDNTKFPSGMKALADYVHSKGLKLGIYTDHGTNNCSSCISGGKSPGSYGYEYIDAMTFASYGVEYLKNDSCNQPPGDVPQTDYFKMADGLMSSGQPIVVSLCANREHYEYWSPDLGNLWRTTGDISDSFSSMIGKIDPNSKSASMAGPGRWNDPDMMEVGNGGMTDNEYRAHFTMWCIMAAPLISGNDLRSASGATLAILTNAEAIAVDQDPAGEQGIRVSGSSSTGEVWSKPLGYDFSTRAVALLNRSSSAQNITCYWTNLGLQAGSATVRDLWAHTDLGTFTDSFTANVPTNSAVFLKIVGTPLPAPPLGTTYLSDLQPIYAYTGYGTLTKDKSIGGNTITLNGVTYSKGIGTHAIGGHEYKLGGVCSRFQSDIGVDDESGSNGSVIFQVFADGTKIYDSGIMTGSSATKSLDLDVSGVQRLTLAVTDTGNDVVPGSSSRNSNDHSDWAAARVVVTNLTPALPLPPSGIAALSGTQINLSWNLALAATRYNVKRSTVNGGPYTNIANVVTTIFTDSNVLVGTTYYYVLSSTNLFGESTNSPQLAVTACTPPAIPTNVKTSVSNLQTTIRWNASAGATSYSIARFTKDSPITNIASGIVATNFTDTAGAAGKTYYYLVAAENGCAKSAFSTFVAAIMPPLAPTGLVAVSGNSQVNLSWSITAGATGYNVKRSTTNGGPYSVIASNVVIASYSDPTVANGTTYYYVVSALNSGGQSADSAQAIATPSAPVIAYWTNTITGAAQSWNVNGNWTNSPNYPNSIGGAAIIAANIPADQTINLNQSVTIGSLNIGDANGSSSYTIAANGGSLIFDNGGASASVLTQTATSKGDTIAAPISIATNLSVANNSANKLILAGTISGAPLTIASGTVQIGDSATSGLLSTATTTNNGSLIFNRSDNTTIGTVISGSGSVMQNGTGVLTLSGANTFSSGVTIENGTLRVGTTTALGSTAGVTIITNGGTLDVNALNLTGEPVIVSGSGVNGAGAIINTGNQQTSALRNIALAGDTVIGGTGPWNPSANINRWDIRAASTSLTNGCSLTTGGHPYKLTKVGGNQISIVAASVDPALGDIDIQGGLMGWETVTSSMGNPASNIIVRAIATLSFYNASTLWNKHFILYGNGANTNMYNWSGANVVIGPMQLNGRCVFWGGGTSLTLGNVVSGTGSLIKTGGYSLILSNANTFAGDTLVNAGTLSLVGAGSISSSSNIVIATGAILNASTRIDGKLTVANGQTLSGNGSVTGDLLIASGATLAAGSSVGALTVSGAASLQGKTFIELDKNAGTNDVLNATSITYGGTLSLTNLSNNLQAGDSFKIFNASSYSGAFTNITPAIPALNLAWNTNGLTNGALSIVAFPTPPPQMTQIVPSGSDFVFSGSNGVPGWPYYVLSSSNMTLPLSNWMRVATNVFSSDGSFIFTNPADSNLLQQFYLLQLP